jgi:predicted metalloprotease with PDZ domain
MHEFNQLVPDLNCNQLRFHRKDVVLFSGENQPGQMKNISGKKVKSGVCLFLLILLIGIPDYTFSQNAKPVLNYTLSMPKAALHYCHVELQVKNGNEDSLHFKMPQWMPGYYQIMNYSKSVENISASDQQGKSIVLKQKNSNTWSIGGIRNKTIVISYDVKADRKFVANSYVDTTRAYLASTGIFLYADGYLKLPVSVKIKSGQPWKHVATGLDHVAGKTDEFTAPDFDILYDCPILIGNLDELPSFKVNGIEHRFMGYAIGSFDQKLFMENLKKIVQASVNVIGDIPFKQYTFIGIGPGRGGIEHLNNTTISFDGSSLTTTMAINKMMNFLAHEYFHHYNVKRIRPFELGPFDYDKGSKTNLLWVSEGLSVYYEYLIVKRAGLADMKTLLANLENNINAVENNPGRFYQSLTQASYNTWKDGPFGTQGDEPGKSISYYDKGPVVGLFLDFAIRNATQNKKSLDDVMQHLYWHYYKKLNRGFTDAEFEQTCETIAGASLARVFEYVYTTKELDYSTYLGYAGLTIENETTETGDSKKTKYIIKPMQNINSLQKEIVKSWAAE